MAFAVLAIVAGLLTASLALGTASHAAPANAAAAPQALGDHEGKALPEWAAERVDVSVDPDGYLADPEQIELLSLPTCLKRGADIDWLSPYVFVDSQCQGTYYVKIIIAFGPDSECRQMSPDDFWKHRMWGVWERFDGLVEC